MYAINVHSMCPGIQPVVAVFMLPLGLSLSLLEGRALTTIGAVRVFEGFSLSVGFHEGL
jgi:hypothetical protein